MRSFQLLGIPLIASNVNEICMAILDRATKSSGAAIVTLTSVHGIVEASEDSSLMELYRTFWFNLPDGRPLSYIGKIMGYPSEQIRGCDLFPFLCSSSVGLVQCFFIGGLPGVAEKAAKNMAEKFPGFVVAGCISPPFRELQNSEIEAYAKAIDQSGAKLIFIGISTPKQEKLMARLAPLLDSGVLLGVGAAFDYQAMIHKNEAPILLRILCLEWFYRLLQEPRRLWKRYLYIVPFFLLRVSKQYLSYIYNRLHKVISS